MALKRPTTATSAWSVCTSVKTSLGTAMRAMLTVVGVNVRGAPTDGVVTATATAAATTAPRVCACRTLSSPRPKQTSAGTKVVR